MRKYLRIMDKKKYTLLNIGIFLICLIFGNFGMKAQDVTIDNLNYNISNGEATCTGGGEGQINLEIPDYIEYEGVSYPVTSIGYSAFFNRKDFTGTLTLPSTLTTIGISAFNGCSGFIGELILPEGLTSIGGATFYSCSGFTGELVLPEGLTSIGRSAFYGCSGFTGDLILPVNLTTIGEYAFYNCSGFTGSLILPVNLTTIEDNTFSRCSGFTGELILPDNLTTIGKYAFSSCSRFNGELILPENLTTIEHGAFVGCRGFNGDLILPENLTSLGEYAFSSCPGFNGELILPKNLTTIGDGAFYGCSGFTGSLILPEGLTSIGKETFYKCSGFTRSLILPVNLTTIGESAFSGCSGFNGDLILPDNLTTIEEYTFSGCSGFTGSLILPETLISIGNRAFSSCSGFNGELILPKNLTTIGQYAFYNCSGFTGELVLPDNLTSMENYAFYGCSGFNGELIIPESLRSIGNYAFYFTEFSKIIALPLNPPTIESFTFSTYSFNSGILEVPNNCKQAYSTATGWKQFKNIVEIIDVESITLNFEELDLPLGHQKQLEAKIYPDNATIQTVEWSSADPSIASVSEEGVITANSLGSTSITATCNNVSTSCIINVVPVYATNIKLNFEQSWLYVNETLKIEAVVEPEDTTFPNVSWESSNENIATISEEGVVTGLSEGEVTITASCDDVSTSCIINVVPVYATNIKLIFDKPWLFVNGTLKIEALVEPENTTFPNVSWKSSNENIATISEEGVVTGLSEGEVTITASCNDVSSSCDLTVRNVLPGDDFIYEDISYVVISSEELICKVKEGSADTIGNPSVGGSITIPETAYLLDTGYKVTEVGNYAFYNNENITEVNLPSSIKSIGDYAFSGCESLVKVNMAESVTTIGAYAFNGCSTLRTLVLPNLTNMEDYLLANCTSLSQLSIPGSVQDISSTAFDGCTGLIDLTLEDSENILEIKEGTFTSLPLQNLYIGRNWNTDNQRSAFPASVGSLILGSTVTELPDYAFLGLAALETLQLPSGLVNIPIYAFSGCESLENVGIPEGVESIGSYAFNGCGKLSEITIPSKVTSIEESIFSGCESLSSVIIEDSKETILITGSSFSDSPVTNLYIGRNWTYTNYSTGMVPMIQNLVFGPFVTEIPENSFVNSQALQSVTIPESIIAIGDYAFSGCNSLTDLTYETNCTSFGKNVFPGTIEQLNIGEKVTEIPNYFLQKGNKIKRLEIPNSVIKIGFHSFIDSYDLISLWIGTGLQTINKEAFYIWPDTDNNIEGRVYDIPKIFWLANTPPDGLEYLKAKINYISNTRYDFEEYKLYNQLSSRFEIDGIIYVPVSFMGDGSTDIVDCTYQETNINVVVPEKVEYYGNINVNNISDYAFYDNDLISYLSLANNGAIGNYAFFSCENIPGVDIPNSITSLGTNSFQDCAAMQYVNLGESIPSLPDYVFAGCSSLEALSVPSNINAIEDYAFEGCTSMNIFRLEESFTDKDNDGNFDEEIIYLGSNGNLPMFNDCPLQSVFIGRRISYNSSEDYGYSPFYRNVTLQFAEITDRETRVYDNEFYGCSGLKTLSIGNGVNTIGKWAFSGCSSLEFFSAGYEVDTIGEEAFSDCIGMTEYYSYSQIPPECGDQALEDIRKPQCALYVPYGSKDLYAAAPQWGEFIRNMNEMDPVEVEEIEISDKDVYLKPGDNYQLIATVLPQNASFQDVIWESSDETIATVTQDGFITALKDGAAIIMVKSADYDVEAQCNVYVGTIVIDVEKIDLNATYIEMEIGETAHLTATLTPSNATERDLTWSSSNDEVVTVDNQGNVTAMGIGRADITATATNGVSASCEISVNPIEVTSVSFNIDSKTLKIGEIMYLQATVAPENATDKSLVWTSSDPEVASVAEGLVTALAVGSTTIKAESNNGLYDTCIITVTTPDVESIEIVPSEATIQIGSSIQLEAKVYPEAAQTTYSWNSNDSNIAVVDPKGKVTGLMKGNAIISVRTLEGYTAICNITVETNVIEVSSVTLDKESYTGKQGTTLQLNATVSPNNATNKSVSWTTSNSEVATVTSSGLVSLVGMGNATITATSGSKSATCSITVTAPAATGVTLTPTSGTIKVGGTYELTANVTPANAETTFKWSSSNPTVASVSDYGVVTGVSTGNAIITVETAEGQTASCNITVETDIIPVTSVILNKNNYTGEQGTSVQLSATVGPDNATDKNVTWTSSNPAVATVSNSGLVDLVGIGSANISATSGNITATCEVTVTAPSPTQVTVTPSSVALTVGETLQLRVSLTPSNAETSYTWSSSNSGVAAVSSTGLVTAISEGSSSITVNTANGKSATAEITVKSNIVAVISVTLDKTSYTGKQGTTLQLSASVDPDNATDKSVTWTTSNSSVATVSNSGLVSLQGEGSAIITATAGSVSATCAITVMAPAATGVTITPASGTIKVGGTLELTASVTPANAETTLTWSSSNLTVASVSDSGVVTGVSNGSAVITVETAEGYKASCNITVEKDVIPVTSVTLDKNSYTGKKGTTLQLNATVSPNNATDKTVTWTSSNADVASVSNSGLVSLMETGTATITATSGNASATCQITVETNEVAVTGVTLSPTNVELKVGSTKTLTATVIPANATNKTLTWTSSNTSVATVSNGIVKGENEGSATITVKTANGLTATCEVNVTTNQPAQIEVTNIQLNSQEVVMTLGEVYQLTATVYPDNATDKTVTWNSSNPQIVSVNKNGKVTALNLGDAIVTATTSNGLTATCLFTIEEKSVETIYVEKIVLSETEVSASEGYEFILTATVYPENATNKSLLWSTDNINVVTVNYEGGCKIVGEGDAVITVMALDGSDVTAECIITGYAGIEEIMAEEAGPWYIITLNGEMIRQEVDAELIKNLAKGIYVLTNGKTSVKVYLNR